jgi:hypothetical protein
MVSKACTQRKFPLGVRLLGRADEALGDAIALRLADEGRRALDAEEADLGLEVARRVVRAAVVAQRQAVGGAARDGAEVAPHTSADRLERLEAVARGGGMNADALAGAVVRGDEDARLALGEGDGLGHVGAPHGIDAFGGDGAVMGPVSGAADAMRRQQPVLAHRLADPPGRSADAGEAQPRPDLAVALAV